MLHGENYKPQVCSDCKVELIPQVCQSAAGYYIGTYCGCGPYSRDTDYFGKDAAAKQAAEYCLATLFRGMDRLPGHFAG